MVLNLEISYFPVTVTLTSCTPEQLKGSSVAGGVYAWAYR
jgi:hypothetical protein